MLVRKNADEVLVTFARLSRLRGDRGVTGFVYANRDYARLRRLTWGMLSAVLVLFLVHLALLANWAPPAYGGTLANLPLPFLGLAEVIAIYAYIRIARLNTVRRVAFAPYGDPPVLARLSVVETFLIVVCPIAIFGLYQFHHLFLASMPEAFRQKSLITLCDTVLAATFVFGGCAYAFITSVIVINAAANLRHRPGPEAPPAP
ncbi:hypothetical protein [Nitrospirillum iridis]|uniref:Uncharacterized protein n=1 Tax=Nitrospirillum iridis TaxID=765888 RepID=A0A7X0ED37_9PROT|nr:hypothetical protein [Nitrospirillum iridis]MBB6252402.1 hypothetical protein [Nitrospirillum iridis]